VVDHASYNNRFAVAMESEKINLGVGPFCPQDIDCREQHEEVAYSPELDEKNPFGRAVFGT
jgi:hypothetical protein